MSSNVRTAPNVLPVTPRYLRRNAARAMGGSLVRGLVELVTNGRDSAIRMIKQGGLTAKDLSQRPVEIEVSRAARRIVVRDRFQGMSADTMSTKLIQYGAAVSGFHEGADVRGINARGAKDVAALGEVRFESITETEFAECVLHAGGGTFAGPNARSVTEADRERMAIPSGNGTVVTLALSPEISMPVFDQLAKDLDRHIEIRYRPEGAPTVSFVLREFRDRGTPREMPIEGFEPEGEPLLEHAIDLPAFNAYGKGASLKLLRSPQPLAIAGRGAGTARLWRSEAGILVGDGRNAHDLSFFHARGSDDPVAEHIFGYLHLPHITPLLREYERLEADRERGAAAETPPLNPYQVTDPDRLGLNRDHPFVAAVEEQVRPLIEQAIAVLQKELAKPGNDKVSKELRKDLQKLGRQLAEKLEVNDVTVVDRELPYGLSLIPAGIRVELERPKRVGIYLRVDTDTTPPDLECRLEASTDAIALSASTAQLQPVEGKPGVFRGSFEVTGIRLAEFVTVAVTLGEWSDRLDVSVREPGAIQLDKDLQFSHRRYTSSPGKRKHVEILADPSLAEREVQVSTSNNRVALTQTVVRLTYDENRRIAAASVYAESGTAAEDMLEVKCDNLGDSAAIIFEESQPAIQFEFEVRENYGPGRRFVWDQKKRNVLRIAAHHASLSRVLGSIDQGWPGQHEPQTRAIIAELIAEAYVARRIQQALSTLGTGSDNSVDPIEYESYRYRYYEECLLLCHSALTPKYDG